MAFKALICLALLQVLPDLFNQPWDCSIQEFDYSPNNIHCQCATKSRNNSNFNQCQIVHLIITYSIWTDEQNARQSSKVGGSKSGQRMA